MIIKANNDSFLPKIVLGRLGEKNARSIRFDISDWISDYGKGSVQLIHQRSQDETPYPVAVKLSGSVVIWNVTLTDTAHPGEGKCELRYYVDDTVVKSSTWSTHVYGTMADPGSLPEEPGYSWFDQMLETAARTESASQHPPQISDRNTWMVWSIDANTYIDSGVTAVGGIQVDTAKVGQVIHVIAVDDHGKPTVWEAADLSSLSVAISTMESVLSGKSTLDGCYITDGYYARTEYVTFYDALPFEDDGDVYYVTSCKLEVGKTYYISLNGEPLQEHIWMGEEGIQYTDANGNTYTLGGTTHVITYNVEYPMPECITVEGYQETVWPLDKKYLPEGLLDTIDGKMNAVNPVGSGAFSVGRSQNSTVGAGSLAVGCQVEASGMYSFATGNYSAATGRVAHAEGEQTKASGSMSHAEGWSTKATGSYSHAECGSTESSGSYSHAEGRSTIAAGNSSHAEGYRTRTGNQTIYSTGITSTANAYGHAEGYSTLASGTAAHAEGQASTASGNSSHAEGQRTTASGVASHAEGYYTVAAGSNSHVEGKYNIEDTAGAYVHIVGNGTSTAKRSNAHTLDWSGNAWYAGTVECTSLILTSSTVGSTKRFAVTVNDEGVLTATELAE